MVILLKNGHRKSRKSGVVIFILHKDSGNRGPDLGLGAWSAACMDCLRVCIMHVIACLDVIHTCMIHAFSYTVAFETLVDFCAQLEFGTQIHNNLRFRKQISVLLAHFLFRCGGYFIQGVFPVDMSLEHY